MSQSSLSLLLMMPSRNISSLAELKDAVKALGESSGALVTDETFIVGPIDWSKLKVDSGDTDFVFAIKQQLNHSCLLNAVRFVFQLRFNCMIGHGKLIDPRDKTEMPFFEGDRVVYSLTFDKYISSGNFESHYLNSHLEAHLGMARSDLNALGIAAGEPDLVSDIAGYMQGIRGRGTRGVLLVAGDANGANHTYVLFEFRDAGGKLEAKIYDPWFGRLLTAADSPASEWIEVRKFQEKFAQPMETHKQMAPKLEPSGIQKRDAEGKLMFLGVDQRPEAGQILKYSVLFAPL